MTAHAHAPARPSVRVRLGLGSVASIAAIVATMLGGGLFVLQHLFASKEVETKLVASIERERLVDWRLEALQVEQQNVRAKIERLDRNVERVLERLSVRGEAAADAEDAPPAPSPLRR